MRGHTRDVFPQHTLVNGAPYSPQPDDHAGRHDEVDGRVVVVHELGDRFLRRDELVERQLPVQVQDVLQVLDAARKAKLRVFYAMHHRYRPGDYESWKYIAPIQKDAWAHKSFEYGTWGGEIRAEFAPQPGEIVASEHWCSSGFANTDLDVQLKKHGIHRLIVIGLIAHTCIEATVRYAAELGYDVTVVRDATADYSDEMMHAALDINMPSYASAIVTTEEIVGSIASLQPQPLATAAQ